MLTNLASTIMIVFAGGPHTPERTALACELLANRPPPAIIYLTGSEYQDEYSNLAVRVTAIARNLPTHPEVLTDSCNTTWSSCLHLTRDIKRRYPHGASLVVVTSNYHAPRARWLIGSVVRLSSCSVVKAEIREAIGLSPNNLSTRELNNSLSAPLAGNSATQQLNNFSLSILTSPDIPWRESLATSRNRLLIVGEWISWLYCFPLGLICHPILLALIGIPIAGIILLNRRKTGKGLHR